MTSEYSSDIIENVSEIKDKIIKPNEEDSVPTEILESQQLEEFYNEMFKDRYTDKDQDFVNTPIRTHPPCFPGFHLLNRNTNRLFNFSYNFVNGLLNCIYN